MVRSMVKVSPQNFRALVVSVYAVCSKQKQKTDIEK